MVAEVSSGISAGRRLLVSPSILSADFLNLEDEILSIGDADLIHVDVMDGHFVPNLTVGPLVCRNIHRVTDIPLDIHLMVRDTGFFIDMYAPLNPRFMTIHAEEEPHVSRLLQKIRDFGIGPGIALNPHTPVDSLRYVIEYLDIVLVMSVNPGFGGQTFMESSLRKILDLRKVIDEYNPHCKIGVDGGVNGSNIHRIKEAGVDIVVAGSYIFSAENRQKAILSLR